MEFFKSLLSKAKEVAVPILQAAGAYPSDAGQRVAAMHELIVEIASHVEDARTLYGLIKLSPPRSLGEELAVDALWLIMCTRRYHDLTFDWLERCGKLRTEMVKHDKNVGHFWFRTYFLLSVVVRLQLLRNFYVLATHPAFPAGDAEVALGAWYGKAAAAGALLSIGRGLLAHAEAPLLRLAAAKVRTIDELGALIGRGSYTRDRGNEYRYIVTALGGFKFAWTINTNFLLLLHVPISWTAIGVRMTMDDKVSFFARMYHYVLRSTRGAPSINFLITYPEDFTQLEGRRLDTLFAAFQLPDKGEKQILYRAPALGDAPMLSV